MQGASSSNSISNTTGTVQRKKNRLARATRAVATVAAVASLGAVSLRVLYPAPSFRDSWYVYRSKYSTDFRLKAEFDMIFLQTLKDRAQWRTSQHVLSEPYTRLHKLEDVLLVHLYKEMLDRHFNTVDGYRAGMSVEGDIPVNRDMLLAAFFRELYSVSDNPGLYAQFFENLSLFGISLTPLYNVAFIFYLEIRDAFSAWVKDPLHEVVDRDYESWRPFYRASKSMEGKFLAAQSAIGFKVDGLQCLELFGGNAYQSKEELKRLWKRKILQFHPDKLQQRGIKYGKAEKELYANLQECAQYFGFMKEDSNRSLWSI